jgi:hypothetical protein
MSDPMMCPRRSENPGGVFELPDHDTWVKHAGRDFFSCSYCGSMHPDEFLSKAEHGVEIGPTDKPYKVYINNSDKFYFQHLDVEQRKKFVDLINEKKLKIGYPGHFYVLPFFAKPAA